MPTLDWIGKKAVLSHHREVPYHLLRCDRSLSAGKPDSENLLVQGDTLGLRAFLEKSANNAPFGLLVTRDDAPAVADPRILTVGLSALLIVR